MGQDEWVIMPCYNEEKNIVPVIRDTLKFSKNLVVVDDGSKDNTYQAALDNCKNAYVLRHSINLGKGAALKTGVEFAIKKGAKKFVFIDSDGQHEPKEIPKFLKLLDDHDIVFGFRKLNKNMPAIFRIGNTALNTGIFFLFGIRLHDTQSGYRAMTVDAYRKIRWKSTTYTVESEMIANTGKKKLRYCEIPINTIYANRHKGTTVLDGIKIMFDMLLFRFQR
ncbi:glycosyltransferase family 2 protein [Candidatus Woesearchaeota archaeon]|nr:glycosyltransferase family 2 protein [Candidatus Woesearchaeota archaeon]